MTQESTNNPKQRGGIAYQSKLLPYAKEIAAWQREGEGKSYREIAGLLKEKYGLEVHPETINAFVLVRARRKKRVVLPDEYLSGQPMAQNPAVPAAIIPTVIPKPASGAGNVPSQPASTSSKPTRGMLPPKSTKHHDSYGRPVEPPPDPRSFRSENL
jgi:hypothetical protein